MSNKPDYEKIRNELLSKFIGMFPKRLWKPVVAFAVIAGAIAITMTIFTGVEYFGEKLMFESNEVSSDTEISPPQFINLEVEKEYSDNWSDWTYVTKDERAICRATFTNVNNYKVENVILSSILTDNIEIVDEIILYDDEHPDGITVDGQLENVGIDIGDYLPNESAEIIFYLRAVDPEEESHETVTAKVSINGNSYQHKASVEVRDSNGGWGDNTNGRRSYTTEEVDSGKLGDLITFNSISDGEIGHEFNFVGARQVDETGLWHASSLEVEDGELYTVRMYIHNDNPVGHDAVAKDVMVKFDIPMQFSKEQNAIGYLESSNTVPTKYWDGVTFKSDQYFFIEYIEGSARLYNDGIGKNDGIPLPNEIVTSEGATIGYNALDGQIPGGYDYWCRVEINVQVHMKKLYPN